MPGQTQPKSFQEILSEIIVDFSQFEKIKVIKDFIKEIAKRIEALKDTLTLTEEIQIKHLQVIRTKLTQFLDESKYITEINKVAHSCLILLETNFPINKKDPSTKEAIAMPGQTQPKFLLETNFPINKKDPSTKEAIAMPGQTQPKLFQEILSEIIVDFSQFEKIKVIKDFIKEIAKRIEALKDTLTLTEEIQIKHLQDIRTKLTQFLDESKYITEINKVAHSCLILLATNFPINKKDPSTKEVIEDQHKVFVSSGYQLDIHSIIQFHHSRAPNMSTLHETYNADGYVQKYLVNPTFFEPFNRYDCENIIIKAEDNMLDIQNVRLPENNFFNPQLAFQRLIFDNKISKCSLKLIGPQMLRLITSQPYYDMVCDDKIDQVMMLRLSSHKRLLVFLDRENIKALLTEGIISFDQLLTLNEDQLRLLSTNYISRCLLKGRLQLSDCWKPEIVFLTKYAIEDFIYLADEEMKKRDSNRQQAIEEFIKIVIQFALTAENEAILQSTDNLNNLLHCLKRINEDSQLVPILLNDPRIIQFARQQASLDIIIRLRPTLYAHFEELQYYPKLLELIIRYLVTIEQFQTMTAEQRDAITKPNMLLLLQLRVFSCEELLHLPAHQYPLIESLNFFTKPNSLLLLQLRLLPLEKMLQLSPQQHSVIEKLDPSFIKSSLFSIDLCFSITPQLVENLECIERHYPSVKYLHLTHKLDLKKVVHYSAEKLRKIEVLSQYIMHGQLTADDVDKITDSEVNILYKLADMLTHAYSTIDAHYFLKLSPALKNVIDVNLTNNFSQCEKILKLLYYYNARQRTALPARYRQFLEFLWVTIPSNELQLKMMSNNIIRLWQSPFLQKMATIFLNLLQRKEQDRAGLTDRNIGVIFNDLSRNHVSTFRFLPNKSEQKDRLISGVMLQLFADAINDSNKMHLPIGSVLKVCIECCGSNNELGLRLFLHALNRGIETAIDNGFESNYRILFGDANLGDIKEILQYYKFNDQTISSFDCFKEICALIKNTQHLTDSEDIIAPISPLGVIYSYDTTYRLK